MTTSKEQQPSIPEESYSNEDTKLIGSLLNEYSEKLLNICDQIEMQKRREQLFLFLLIFNPILFSVVLSYGDLFFALNTGLFFAFIIIALAILALLFMISHNAKQKVKFLVRNARILSVKLEKIIRLASQVQEHVLNNFVSRVELDLRLAEAESALQHCTDLLEATRKSFFRSFFRFLVQ